jgi:hypothetical protein
VPLKPALLEEIRRRTGASPSYHHYGLCGGAILRTSALRDTPDMPVGLVAISPRFFAVKT